MPVKMLCSNRVFYKYADATSTFISVLDPPAVAIDAEKCAVNRPQRVKWLISLKIYQLFTGVRQPTLRENHYVQFNTKYALCQSGLQAVL